MTPRDKFESKKGIALSGGRCIVCGWDKRDFKSEPLVEGAHVRPFRKTSDYDKFDNIVGLCPNHHTEYDVGNITIDPVSRLCICVDSKNSFHLKKIAGRVDHVKLGYFDYHKKHIFKKI